MRRSRRLALGLVAAAVVHGLAGLALLPVVRLSLQDHAHPSDVDAPLTIVQLVRLSPRQGPVRPQPQASHRSRPVSLPEAPAPFDLALSDPVSPGPSAPSRPADDDPLFRAPFRDAVAHADSRLRAGLSCAHVDLGQLPRSLLDLCSAAARVRDDAAQPRGPFG